MHRHMQPTAVSSYLSMQPALDQHGVGGVGGGVAVEPMTSNCSTWAETQEPNINHQCPLWTFSSSAAREDKITVVIYYTHTGAFRQEGQSLEVSTLSV